jgi:PAS domain S-box-containing protein
MNEVLVQYGQIAKIFDHLSLGVLILSPDRRIFSMNRSAEQLTGYKQSDLIGKYCYAYFKDYLCGGTCKYLDTSLENRNTIVTDVEFIDENRGEYSLVKIESPLFDLAGNIVGCMEIFQDQTAIKKLVHRIRFEDTKLKLILENLDLGVLTVDRSHHISFFNKKAETVTGFSRLSVLGKTCDTIIDPELCRQWRTQEFKKDKEGVKVKREGKIKTAVGNFIPADIHYMSMKDEDGKRVGGLITLTDLSLRHQFDKAIKARYTFHDMIGKDPVMRRLFESVPVIAASNATVLIEGPTGTGKDLVARIIHNESRRCQMPFVKVNCASLPETLLESEMFGYAKGAFTGAEKNKPGRFQLADKGTIFLDEIGDLPLSLQAKLLRVLEDREFYPLGSETTTKVNVRIISATNQDLERLVAKKQFREDLFYRINVMRLKIPPISERKGDLPLLIPHILKRLCINNNKSTPKITQDAMEVLLNYAYPGNVRELENILEHCLVICGGAEIKREHLPITPLKDPAKSDHLEQHQIDQNEKEHILRTLEEHEWNKSMTARALNIDRTTLWRKMKKFDIVES